MDGLFEAVRRACPAGVWSRGVELARAGAVRRESGDADEVVLRVLPRGGLLTPRVTLYPDDAEWDCDCPSRSAVCEHVAAAAIALRRAGEGNQKALRDAGPESGTIRYRFARHGDRLHFERAVAGDDGWRVLEATIAAVASGRVAGPRVDATQTDLAVELALGTFRSGALPRQLLRKLLPALARASDVTLDDRPVRVSTEPVLPTARVADHGDGFRLSLHDPDEITETFANGLALCGETLRPIGESGLTGRERYELPRGKYYGPDAVAELVTEVLPELERRIPVDVRSQRLPTTSEEAPRVVLDLERDDVTLHVLPTLVYGDPPTARIDGGRLVHLRGPVPVRDPAGERRAVARLQRELGLAIGVRESFHGEAAVRFTERLGGWDQPLASRAQEFFRRAAPLRPRLDVHEDDFDLVFESAAASGPRRRAADSATVLRAWREGATMVPLASGGWAPLPLDWLSRFGHRVADLLAARDEAGELPRCVLPDLARLCDELEQPPPAALGRLRARLEAGAGIPAADLPTDLEADLRPYQRRGVDWLAFLGGSRMGALLADDMGLGKTLQALCVLRGRTLAVAPTSVLPNWAEEARRFRPDLRVAVYHGRGRVVDPDADLTLTTYAILRLDRKTLAAERWDTVVLDESQAIKNPESHAARAAFALDAGFRIALTGTPVENRLDELWSQFHFLNRGLLGGRSDFAERYARPIAEGDRDVAAHLRRRIAPFVLRRRKDEVAPELPPRTEVVLHCELDERERQVYDAVRAATRDDVVKRLQSGGGGVLAALEALLRLRQAACHSGLVPGQEAATSSKVELLLDSLRIVVAEGRKALVFSQWTSLLDRIEPHLGRAAIDHVRLDGSTRDRAGVVARFQDAGGPPVMLISLKAGGTGLNLTAADHVFIVDPWWNPAVEAQAADRAHRIGQDRPVMVYRLVAEETVEGRILALQERKRGLAEAALGEASRAEAITRDELLALLD